MKMEQIECSETSAYKIQKPESIEIPWILCGPNAHFRDYKGLSVVCAVM